MITRSYHALLDAWNQRRESAQALTDLIAYRLQQACDYNVGDDEVPSLDQFLQLQDCIQDAFNLHKEINALVPGFQTGKATVLCGYLRLQARLRSVCDLAMTHGTSWMDVDHQFWQFGRDEQLHWKEASAAMPPSPPVNCQASLIDSA